MIILKEVFIGLMIGYLVSIIFWVIGSAGALIDTQRGASIASVLNPQFGDQTTPVGLLLSQVMTTFFFVSGGFLVFLDGLYQSYQAWPVFSFFPNFSMDGAQFFLEQFDLLFYLTFFLAGPVVLGMFIAEFGMALISRFAQQLNVFVLAMPLKSGIGIFVLVVYVGSLVTYFGDEFRSLGKVFDMLDTVLR